MVSKEQIAQLKQLGDALKVELPPKPARPKKWGEEARQHFYKPRKRAISLRLDEDVVMWLKKDGKGYQTRANKVLREWMVRESEGR